mgnify:CR=1 FL=1
MWEKYIYYSLLKFIQKNDTMNTQLKIENTLC